MVLVNVLERKFSVISSFLVVLAVIFVIGNAVSYNSSPLIARVTMVATISILFILMIVGGISKEFSVKLRIISFALFLTSMFFLIWRSTLFKPIAIERILNTETFQLTQRYADGNSLVFDSAHSFFFLDSSVLHSLWTIGGFSNETMIYVTLFVYGILAALIGILVYKKLMEYVNSTGRRNWLLQTFSSLIAFAVIAFAYSERSAYATKFSVLVTLTTLWFLAAAKDLDNRREVTILLLLLIGVTIGDTNGIFILIPFFFVYGLFSRKLIYFGYALIPLSYLLFSAEQYSVTLRRYAFFAYNGLQEFFEKIVGGQAPERLAPWQRVSSRMVQDTIVSSTAYLSLFFISLIIIFFSAFIWIRGRKKFGIKSVRDRVNIICLLLWFGIAGVTYVGASIMPETSFSDIRTIAIILLSLFLPFVFVSKKLIPYLGKKKFFLVGLMLLFLLASMVTVYPIYPKSSHDPIYAAEDSRLGTIGIYVVADFLLNYSESGGIIFDYKTLNRIGRLIPDSNYEKRFLDTESLWKPFSRFPNRTFVVFNVAGLKYPSIYHSPEAYMAANNYSVTHNRIYDNGIVVVASNENGAS
jgi:hypothetical protein